MIKEQGVVQKVQNNKATIRIVKKDECSKCGMCGMRKDQNHYDFTVKTDLNLQINEVVNVTFIKDNKLTAIFFGLILPFIALIVGVVIGYLLQSELLMVLLGLGLTAVTYLFLPLVDKKLSKKTGYQPKVEKIKKGE